MNAFLFELGIEEIPAPMIEPALERLQAGLQGLLAENSVTAGRVHGYSTPRRLAVLIEGLPDRQPDREEEVVGPPESVALDEKGDFTPAARGFARKVGCSPEELKLVETDRGRYLASRQRIAGLAVPKVLTEGLTEVITSIPWPKSMYWGESRFRFARPIRWLVLLWNDQVLSYELEGVASGRVSRGHRFLASKVDIDQAGGYGEALRKAYVIVDPAERRGIIERQLAERAGNGLKVLPDQELLATVVHLNEFPGVVRGDFKSDFLEIPQEVLLTVMRHHQKYFGVVDGQGRLQAHFLTVINRADDDGRIQRGHEKVLQARLEDAAFFWQNDQKKSLQDRVPELQRMVYQKELGTYLDKARRLEAISAGLGGDSHLSLAARLAKTDLTTQMVFEFPELQGVMGGLYARRQGHPEPVWRAIYEHYKPESMEDPGPETLTGALLSLADRIDAIAGCFLMGIVPKGARDPFALRRQAQGMVRILLDHGLDHRLEDLVSLALEVLDAPEEKRPKLESRILEFLLGRVRFVFQQKGLTFDVLNAVLHRGAGVLHHTYEKGLALSRIRSEEDFEALASSFKRIRNILAGQEVDQSPPREKAFEMEGERTLHAACLAVRTELEAELKRNDFEGALRRMATLRGPVDRFFDEVLVLAEEEELRKNRLRLLNQIATMFLEVADISEIVRKD